MRIATFNLESLDLPPKAAMALEARAEALRPALERLQADILCLQEVNATAPWSRSTGCFLAPSMPAMRVLPQQAPAGAA